MPAESGYAEMKCIICDNEKWEEIYLYTTPDKYEKYMGIENVDRDWARCVECGHYQQERNYPLAELEKIYEDGYRSFDFRGETIEQAYNKVMAIPDNENSQRCEWFIDNIGEVQTILDFGSGLGVFPEYLSNRGYDVDCVEANKHSKEFIEFNLKIPCYDKMPVMEYDAITLVHVLEHFENPKGFLIGLKKNLNKNGKLFIEVPDAAEFEHLDKNHDEFNSCHCHFFDGLSLNTLLVDCGYEITAMAEMEYKGRNLKRLLTICS